MFAPRPGQTIDVLGDPDTGTVHQICVYNEKLQEYEMGLEDSPAVAVAFDGRTIQITVRHHKCNYDTYLRPREGLSTVPFPFLILQ